MSCSKSVGTFVIFVAGTLIAPSAASAQTTWYVDDDATSNGVGATWSTAFRYAQDALDIATNGDEIRVAQGTYRPDEDAANTNGTGNRSATFQLLVGVELKGGYAGIGAPDPDLRDLDSNASILSGDIGSDGDTSDNSYHVVTGADNATIDGFSITGGKADGTKPDDRGGGMYNESASPTVVNCAFSANLVE